NSDKRPPPDLWNDWDAILASVANYLHEYGWRAGGPVLAETRLDPDPSFQIEPHNLELNETVESLGAHGVKIELAVPPDTPVVLRSEEHTSELQSPCNLVCRLLLEKKKKKK